jgi:hypothetical protein
MNKILMMLVLAVFSINLFSGCESKQEKAQKAAEERHKKMFGNWEKDVEQWNKSRQKPSKPMWNK